MDRWIGGWIGSVTGYIIADKMDYDLPMTIGMISIGHMGGHYLANKITIPLQKTYEKAKLL